MHYREPIVILPKLSAAILAMSLLGSAFAASSLERNISLDQWVMMCGAVNGAADQVGASDEERHQHRLTSKTHLMRYAIEQGYTLDEFDALFDQGIIEGRKLTAGRLGSDPDKLTKLMNGFHRDARIGYQDVKDALDTA
ncbi:hypothetical protein [Pusillimonas sp. T7-7]|uniref:hypothetical protein n=1 Tax=Pusillimonas sp. (strain T7-7) TaxID=1007105 RepID=UPI0013052FE1|nr:hypothetical protein [Pusillimonas sp. T7-7]